MLTITTPPPPHLFFFLPRFLHFKKQDAREAMQVVFSVLTKRICMHKTKFLMNIFKYCLKIILNSMNLQIATQLIIMFNF